MSGISDDDEVDYGRCKALPVAEFDDFDPTLPPVSGPEYLRRVQLEAQKCPDIVVAGVQKLGDQLPNIVDLPDKSSEFKRLCKDNVPSMEWQQVVVARFSHLRMKVSQIREKIEQNPDKKRMFPAKADMMWWRNHCLGSRRTSANDDESSSSEDDASECTTDTTETAQDENKIPTVTHSDNRNDAFGKPPLLSEVCTLYQTQVHKLLKYHTQWINYLGFSDQSGVWIYALLCCIEKPLPAEIYSTLRDLSRACSVARSKLSPEHTLFQPLSLIICIVGRYFNQLDLVDE